MHGLVCVSLVVVALCSIAGAWSSPLHASCTVNWVFKSDCEKVSTAIVNQVKEWAGPENCQQGGEKCLYHMQSSSADAISIIHGTPKQHYKDDLTFALKTNGAMCNVHGHSTSETWYAILDKGTNYCNLHNLITGSGLDKYPGYNETTSDSECTQFSSSNCAVY